MATILPAFPFTGKTESVLYKLASGFALLAGLIGLVGLVGYMLHVRLLTNWGVEEPITNTTALAIVCLATAFILMLPSPDFKAHNFSIRFACYICILYPLIYGSYYTIYYLYTVHFKFLNILTTSYNVPKAPFLTAVCLTTIAISLLIFFRWRTRENIVVYTVCVPALIIFDITLFGIIGYFEHLPFVAHFMLSMPSSVAILMLSLAILIGTIPFRGLFIPVFSSSAKVKVTSILSLLGGLILISKGLLDIRALHRLGTPTSILLTKYMVISALSTILLSTLFIVISLRSLYNYALAEYHSLLEKEYTDAEALLRRTGEIIYDNISLQEGFFRIAQILSTILDCNYCFITCFNEATEEIKEPSYLHEVPFTENGTIKTFPMKESLTKISADVCKNRHSIEFSNTSPDLTEAYKDFFQSGEFTYSFATPLLYRGDCLGVLLLAQTNAVSSFNQIDKQIVKSLADQIAIAINHHELLSELRTKEVNFKKILEANIIGVFFWKLDGAITYANQAFLDMVEYTREDLQEGLLTWIQLIPSDTDQLNLSSIKEITEKGKSLPVQCQYQTKTGQIVDVIRSSTTFVDTDEEGASFVVDITKLKQIETALLDKNRELEQFASIASHDLQAPLRKIKAFLDLLEEDTKDQLKDSSKDYIERIKNSANRMQQLIGDLLSLARVNRNIKPFELINLKDIFHAVLHDLAVEITQKQAIIEVGNLLSIEADATQMYQLFLNLLSNSLKYQKSDEPPHIHIQMQKVSGNRVRLTLTDNGVGFESEKAEWIFGAFTRLRANEEQKGTGIGLAICRKIVERHRGKIWAVSQPDKGAKFLVELPIHQPVQRATFSIDEQVTANPSIPD